MTGHSLDLRVQGAGYRAWNTEALMMSREVNSVETMEGVQWRKQGVRRTPFGFPQTVERQENIPQRPYMS